MGLSELLAEGKRPFLVTLAAIIFVGWVVYPRNSTNNPVKPKTTPVSTQAKKEVKESSSKPQTAAEKLESCLALWGANHKDVYQSPETCPKLPPTDMEPSYTMDGKIGVVVDVKCQSGAAYRKRRYEYTYEFVEDHIRKARTRQWDKYGITDDWVYQSIDAFPIQGKDVAIMGSQTPWYEAICITNGAARCTTIDFQAINSSHPNITTMTLGDYDANPRQFDVAISISSFEHDGLGRYGDPLRPDGDLQAMRKMKCLVKPGGHLILSVPIGLDKVVWNMHRVYGKLRLPLMLEYWELLGVFGYGFYERYAGHDGGKEAEYQPILVLKNTEGKTSNIEKNNIALEKASNKSFHERFVFPFGQHTDKDDICYNPKLDECKPGQIQPHFW